ncbi:hypothetical protein E1B28_013808 [Marasmius oreades]|uniref:Uncharacterized protein n=1 Tax=Marasmius oreades TaxID=181124 RepID=A0A9P7RQK4_9AGAR|nr:uncharacterized protein E1B28_013808 [Marasmius oreades]KAG7087870.1 hypothetical protein E1B28_013808 [Marasmius oreades]
MWGFELIVSRRGFGYPLCLLEGLPYPQVVLRIFSFTGGLCFRALLCLGRWDCDFVLEEFVLGLRTFSRIQTLDSEDDVDQHVVWSQFLLSSWLYGCQQNRPHVLGGHERGPFVVYYAYSL